ncbi:MAG: DUF4870 domain-containing protein [Planctomycetota bacterium]
MGREDAATDLSGDESDRQWAMWVHLVPLIGAAITQAGPVIGIVWSAIVLNTSKKDSPFVADHAREMLNFSISYLIYAVVGSIIVGALTFLVGLVVFLPALMIFGLVCTILAAVAAGKGRYYRYPMCIRFFNEPEHD